MTLMAAHSAGARSSSRRRVSVRVSSAESPSRRVAARMFAPISDLDPWERVEMEDLKNEAFLYARHRCYASVI